MASLQWKLLETLIDWRIIAFTIVVFINFKVLDRLKSDSNNILKESFGLTRFENLLDQHDKRWLTNCWQKLLKSVKRKDYESQKYINRWTVIEIPITAMYYETFGMGQWDNVKLIKYMLAVA